MRIKTVYVVLAIIGLVLVLLVRLPPWGRYPWAFRVHRDIDTSSGDVRQRVFLLGMQVSSRITVSPFSQEVRRLHLRTPEKRVWKPMNAATRTEFIMHDYDGAIEDCNFLLQLLDQGRVSDQERAPILEKALSNLQAGELDQTDDLIHWVAQQLGSFYGLPPIPKEQQTKSHDHRMKM
jgi:hypothetical protein